MRLDIYLTEIGECQSRTEAKKLITASAVSVNGRAVTKPSFEIYGDEDVVVDKSGLRFVSRGGFKLDAALDAFKITVDGALAIDIGASSGGFTDCLLKRGAQHVIALDSGHGQLVESLRNHSAVTVLENYNARYMRREDFEYAPNLAVMDVSFISATLIFPSLARVLSYGADYVCLIKPQFEVGRSGIGKGGIVKNGKLRDEAVKRVIDSAEATGFVFVDMIESPILGGDGNTEYLAHFKVGELPK